MKDIRIFVASSKELEKERNYLAFLVLAHEDEFAKRGLRVRLAKWEYVDPKMTGARTEDRYLDEMYNCDAALVLFRDIAGMYTREELDKALAAERTGLAPDSRKARLKTHRILFSVDCKPDSDAAKLRESLPEGSYGEWTDLAGLGEAFLALVDAVSKLDGLADVPDEDVRVVSAFVAADDELAADRNAFADTVLNLNEILLRRGVRVKMRFYDPQCHRELLESSEMALVLYDTTCRTFGPDQMKDAYDRTRREENPRRLYVFFRDEDESKLDGEFVAFRNGFAENLGHFFCRFENVDTLKLNFLLSLENALGEGASFVKLDGKVVKADELEVGEITKLPMVANNGGLSSIMSELETLKAKFDEQRGRCKENPQDDDLYGELLDLSVRKNELQQQIDRELSLSLNLAKRMAAISVAEANDTVMRARAKMEEGRIKEAIEILDGASSSLRRRRILRRAEERVDEVAQEIKELAAGNEVEFFRVDAVMSYAAMPFDERFKKSESIYRELAEDLEAYSESCPPAHRPKIDAMLADVLRRFAKLYDEVGDTLSPLPLLEKALKLYRSVEKIKPGSCGAEMAEVHMALAGKERINNHFEQAREHYDIALNVFRRYDIKTNKQLAECLYGLALLHSEMNMPCDAEHEFRESLDIRRHLAEETTSGSDDDISQTLNSLANLYITQNRLKEAESIHEEALLARRKMIAICPEKYEKDLAQSLDNIACLYSRQRRFPEAGKAHAECLSIFRRLAVDNPSKFEECVARALNNFARVLEEENQFEEAERKYGEALSIVRRLAVTNPDKFTEYVAGTLDNMVGLHTECRSLEKAEKESAEALSLWRWLMEKVPEKFTGHYVTALNGRANLFRAQSRFEEAARDYGDVISICRGLAKTNPEKFEEHLAVALKNLAGMHEEHGCHDEAGNEYSEALQIMRHLLEKNAAKFKEAVVTTLISLANLHLKQGRAEEAEQELLEVAELDDFDNLH